MATQCLTLSRILLRCKLYIRADATAQWRRVARELLTASCHARMTPDTPTWHQLSTPSRAPFALVNTSGGGGVFVCGGSHHLSVCRMPAVFYCLAQGKCLAVASSADLSGCLLGMLYTCMRLRIFASSMISSAANIYLPVAAVPPTILPLSLAVYVPDNLFRSSRLLRETHRLPKAVRSVSGCLALFKDIHLSAGDLNPRRTSFFGGGMTSW